MKKLNAKKLLNSKWTAVKPINKDKHFIISRVNFDKKNNIMTCLLEAILSHQKQTIDWLDLKKCKFWIRGWK